MDNSKRPNLEWMNAIPSSMSLEYGDAELADDWNRDSEFPKYKRVCAVFRFSDPGYGFGEVTILSVNGKTFIDTECTGKERIKKFFNTLIDNAVTDYDTDPDNHRAYNEAAGRHCGHACEICYPRL